MVSGATRAAHTLDLFLTNRPDTISVQVVQSSVRTDHMALLINSHALPNASPSQSLSPSQFRCTAIVYDNRSQHIINLIMALEDYNWSHILADTDDDTAYQAFLDIIGTSKNTFLLIT